MKEANEIDYDIKKTLYQDAVKEYIRTLTDIKYFKLHPKYYNLGELYQKKKSFFLRLSSIYIAKKYYC